MTMSADVNVFVLSDCEESPLLDETTEDLIALIQSCLDDTRTVFMVCSTSAPIIKDGSFIMRGGDGGGCRALAVDRQRIGEVRAEASYALETFHLFILEDRDAASGSSAFRVAERLTEAAGAGRDVLLITNEGSPPELFSDTRFDRVVCINKMNRDGAVREALQSLWRLPQRGAGIPTVASGGTKSPAEDAGAAGGRACPRERAHPLSLIRAEFLALIAVIAAGFVVSVLMSGGPEVRYTAPSSVPLRVDPQAPAAPAVSRQIQRDDKGGAERRPAALLPLRPFTVSLSEATKKAYVELQVQLDGRVRGYDMGRRMRQLNAAFAECIRAQSSAALLSPSGREQLKRSLVHRGNQVLGTPAIKNIVITRLVLQERFHPRTVKRQRNPVPPRDRWFIVDDRRALRKSFAPPQG